MSSNNRDNRKPFTFWFDKQLKDQIKQRASQMGTTTTELVNKAVKIYLEKGYVYDDEDSARYGMNIDISQELGQTSKMEEKFSEINSLIKGLQARIESLESQMDISNEIDHEYIQNQIKLHVQSKVDPIISAIGQTIDKLNIQTSKM